MLAWYVQWKGYLPGLVGAVIVPLPPPPSIAVSKRPAWSEVTVCEAPSELVMTIFAPGFTLTGTWYAKSLMVIAAGAADGAAGVEGAVDDPLAEGIGMVDVDGFEGVVPAVLVVDEAAAGGVALPCPVLAV